MSPIVVGLLGFLTIASIVVTLFKSKTLPSIAFIVFPSILAIILVLGGYYSFENVGSLIKEGFKSTGPTAALFVFSVLFFGIMSDAGMFDVIINQLMKLVGDNVMGVTIMTAVIATVAHLDGAGAATFCIVIPAMLPIYKKMHMRATTLLRIAVLSMGVLNLLPWAGPTMRAASVLGQDAGNLWKTVLPIQIFGILLSLGNAFLAGIQEVKRGAGLNGDLAKKHGKVEVEENKDNENSELARPKLFVFNLILTIIVIALLIWDKFPSYFPFMIGVAIAVLVNYTDIKLQKKVINLHAGPALMMCSTLMSAAVLMGILVKTVTVNDVEIASALGSIIVIILDIQLTTLALAFDTDSYFYGMLPIMIGIGQQFKIAALPIAIAMVVCRNCATFISPMVPATLLGVGLAEVDIKDHIKNSFLYVWGFSIICLIFAVIIGIIPL